MKLSPATVATMIWLTEKPLVIVLMGVTTAIVFGGLWMQTGRKSALYALLGALLATGALLVLERFIVTDREQIDILLHQAAREVERNDLEALFRHTHSRAEWIRQQARAELPRYVFENVSIKSNLEITVRADRRPPTARARFNAVVTLSEREGLIHDRRIPRYVVVDFEKEDDAWRVVGYEHHDPSRGLLRRK